MIPSANELKEKLEWQLNNYTAFKKIHVSTTESCFGDDEGQAWNVKIYPHTYNHVFDIQIEWLNEKYQIEIGPDLWEDVEGNDFLIYMIFELLDENRELKERLPQEPCFGPLGEAEQGNVCEDESLERGKGHPAGEGVTFLDKVVR